MSESTTSSTPERDQAFDYFRPIWARRWLIVLIVAIATAGTYVYENGKPRVYGATTTMYVGGSDIQSVLAGGAASTNAPQTLSDLARLITSPPVYVAAAKLAESKGYELQPVNAQPVPNTDFITISADAGSPDGAAVSANAFANAFIQVRKQSLRSEAAAALAQVESQLASIGANTIAGANLQQQISELRLQEADPSGSVTQLSPAFPDPFALSPNPKQDALFALALSLLVGIALSYGLDRLDQRIRSEEDLQPLYGVPLVGEIPHVIGPAPTEDGIPVVNREHWESFRMVRTNLELATGSRPLRTILVASALGGEGKSLVVRNLGLAYADAGFRVAIIEGDLRRPSLAQLLNVEPEPGLTDVLSHVELLPKAVQSVASQPVRAPVSTLAAPSPLAVSSDPRGGLLDVVTSGAKTESLTAALAAEGIKSVLARMTEEYDVVLIDSAPLLAVSDAVPLLGVVDGVVLVARMRMTTEHAARRVTELLGRATGARVLGVVANDVSRRQFQYAPHYDL